jgi:hypothetical protein
MSDTRSLLSRFIDQAGITDASIMLHRHPIKLVRWRNGQEDIPEAVAKRLAGWDAGVPGTLTRGFPASRLWRTARASSWTRGRRRSCGRSLRGAANDPWPILRRLPPL